MTAQSYLPIADYGVIGDLHTAALVGRNGSIDWVCAPRFDSPSIFGALLDSAQGGCCRIAPTSPWVSEQRYLPATNILETAFHCDEGGVVQVTDFMPVGPVRTGTEIHRRVHCPRGPLTVDVVFQPRFNYGRQDAVFFPRKFGVLATDREDDVATIASPLEIAWRIEAGAARTSLRMETGQTLWFVLRFDDDEVHPLDSYGSDRKFEETARWWDNWTAQLKYRGPYRREVERSALALKLCCYEPSGAIIAAPTTSLPETQGGGRNWDYRFTWLRDSAFVLYALDRLGVETEMRDFLLFLKRVCRRVDGRHLQIMFAVDGTRKLPEQVLEYLDGYQGSRPVRIGNGAVDQFQLDIYGELLETAAIWHRRHPITEGLWQVLRDLVDWTAANWREPDYGIWEARVEPRHYVHSKVMAWATLDSGIRIATRQDLPGNIDRWRHEAEALHAEVLEKGWDPRLETFVQTYGGADCDASLLIIPMVHFLPRTDPRVRSTLSAIRKQLASPCEELIYRYRSADGLGGDEGAFLVCSFWMVQNLALVGETAEAERLFRNLLRRTNHVGLMAEEIDPATGDQLGNFPQALSHAALINTACVLEQLRVPQAATDEGREAA